MKSSRWLLGLVTLSLLLTGCPEKRRPAGSATTEPAANKTAEPAKTEKAVGPLADYVRTLSNSEKKATEVTGLAAIEQAINQFNVIEGRYPKTMDEMVALRYMVKIPPAPRGQRYIYDPSNGSVKAVDLPNETDAPQAPAASTPDPTQDERPVGD